MKKTLSILLLAAMLIGLLAGCAKDGKPEENNTEAGNATETQSAEKEQTGEPIELVYSGPDEWVRSQLQTDKGGYEKIVEKFEAENPGVTVKLTSEPWGNWLQKQPVLLAGGDAPDVFMINGDDAASYYEGGYTADLGDMDPDFLAKFYPGCLEGYKQGDTIMALPFTTDCRVLWYNKEIFEAAGLDPEKPPRTWDEMVEYAKKCSEVTIDGQKVYGFGMDLGLKFAPTQSLLCATPDGCILDADMKPAVNTDTFRKYLQTQIDMRDTFQTDYVSMTHEDTAILFGQKKIAMIIAGGWVWALNEGMADEDWYGMAPTPKMDENSPDGSFAGGWAIAVSSKSKHLAEAKKFAQAMYDDEIGYMLSADVPPFTPGDSKCELFNNPNATVFAQEMINGRKIMPPCTHTTEINTIVWEESSKAITGECTIDEAIAAMEERINKVLN